MKKRLRRKVIVLVVLLSLLVILIPTAAWFSFKSEKDVNVEKVDILAPYRIYLRDSTEKITFSLSIGNLHPGEVLDIPFCVTNDPEGMDVSEEEKLYPKMNFSYQLELARTDNIPLQYTLFPAEEVADKDVQVTGNEILGSDISETRWGEVYGKMSKGDEFKGIINLGKYTRYPKDDSYKMEIISTDDEYDYDYYILRIVFQLKDDSGTNIDFKKYEKETDLIYLSATVNQTISSSEKATQ